jgi:hypothetical protein
VSFKPNNIILPNDLIELYFYDENINERILSSEFIFMTKKLFDNLPNKLKVLKIPSY